jgi:hypothetical protein
MTEASISESAPVQSEAQESAPQSATQERQFKQNEVNEIVKRAKNEAVETYKRVSTQQPAYAEQKYGSPYIQAGQTPTPGTINENEVRRLASEEFSSMRDKYLAEAKSQAETQSAQRIVQTFHDKIAAGKDKYADFDQVTGSIALDKFPNVVQLLAEHVDNSGDMLYEFGKNRLKLAQLEQLSYMSPQDAIAEAKRLSQSIRDNESASKTRNPNQPLSQLRPSNTGTDVGELSVSAYRKKYKG